MTECSRCETTITSRPRYRRGEPYCSVHCARVATGVASDTVPEAVGTADELGIAVYEGVDPSEVTVYDDGTHRGPPKFKETGETETDSTWMAHPVVAMYCPCGHYIRDVVVSSRPELDSVRCEGHTTTVDELCASTAEETTGSRQQTLAEVCGR